jgi:hypothetical protein
MALPAFLGNLPAMNRRIEAASLGPLPFVLTII